MSDTLNQKISQYLDDDLDSSESLKLLQLMQQEPRHQATMQRYALINHALKTRPTLMADTNFSEQLHAKLASEPVYLLRQQAHRKNTYWKPALALAASLMAVAILVPVAKKISAEHSPEPALAMAQLRPANIHNNAVRGMMVPQNAIPPTRMFPVNKRFQDYLQAHNGSLYTNGAANFQYSAQLAGYGQGE